MSGPTSNPGNYNTFNTAPFNTNTSSNGNGNRTGIENGNGNVNRNGQGQGEGDVSPKRKQSSQHIKLPDHLNRPHLAANHRTLSDALRAVRSREEQETLLGQDEEVVDPDGCVREDGGVTGPREIFCQDPHAGLMVYYTIHR
jgi:hypothetical protein